MGGEQVVERQCERLRTIRLWIAAERERVRTGWVRRGVEEVRERVQMRRVRRDVKEVEADLAAPELARFLRRQPGEVNRELLGRIDRVLRSSGRCASRRRRLLVPELRRQGRAVEVRQHLIGDDRQVEQPECHELTAGEARSGTRRGAPANRQVRSVSRTAADRGALRARDRAEERLRRGWTRCGHR